MLIFTRIAIFIGASVFLSACATNPNADQTPTPLAYDVDCYVTGSLNRIRSADCQQAKRDRGVSTVDPKTVKTAPMMTPGDISR
jgi:hypothetical protein